jgi:hypothetical protein
MAKSVFAKKLDLIQAEAHKYLSQSGYKKKGRTFNKSLDSGLIHVINFQMGKRSLAGKFTINLGVYIPEIYRAVWDKEAPRFVNHGNCEIEKRIGELIYPHEDLWWDLNKNPKRLSKKVVKIIDKYSLPFLNKFNTQENIILEWNEHGESIGLPPRAGLSIAILLANSGKHEQARSLLIQEYEQTVKKPYAEFVISIANKLGISLENE